MRISDFARVAGLSPSAVRYYEKEGILPAARRVGGRRVYTAGDILTARLVRTARELGLPIRAIRELASTWYGTSAGGRDLRAVVLHRLAEVDAEIARLSKVRTRLHRLDVCRCEALHGCHLLERD